MTCTTRAVVGTRFKLYMSVLDEPFLDIVLRAFQAHGCSMLFRIADLLSIWHCFFATVLFIVIQLLVPIRCDPGDR